MLDKSDNLPVDTERQFQKYIWIPRNDCCKCTKLLPPGGYPIAVKYIVASFSI